MDFYRTYILAFVLHRTSTWPQISQTLTLYPKPTGVSSHLFGRPVLVSGNREVRKILCFNLDNFYSSDRKRIKTNKHKSLNKYMVHPVMSVKQKT